MTHIISVINSSGGVGKTTLTLAMARLLSEVHEKRVLAIDLGNVPNLTLSLIGDNVCCDRTIFENFQGDRTDYSVKITDNLSLIPAGTELSLLSDYLTLMMHMKPRSKKRRTLLMDMLLNVYKVWDNYDYVLIDCPSHECDAAFNALAASTDIIIPVTPEPYPAGGIVYINKFLNEVVEWIGYDYYTKGIVVNRMNGGKAIHRQVLQDLRSIVPGNIQIPVYDTIIPENSELITGTMPRYGDISKGRLSKGMEAVNQLILEFENTKSKVAKTLKALE